jgi:hypothetical protein
MAEHPVATLRRELTQAFTSELPEHVCRVWQWCRDPQFFPGATGLIDAASWSEVQPGGEASRDSFGAVVQRGVIVVGNYQATRASYQLLLCDGSVGGFPATWRELPRLLVSVHPREVFLTNAFIGVPDLARDTDPFPRTPEYTLRCGKLLELEFELFRPRCVVCLGVRAAEMVASLATELAAWRPWPGYRALATTESRVVEHCSVGGADFTAIAVRHPAGRQSRSARADDARLIAEASARSS